MPVVLKLINYDELYHKTTTDKILINDIDIFLTENREMLDTIIMQNYSEDNLSIIPSCQCGEIKGEYYVGELCHKCNTYVTSTIEDNVSFLLWCKRPLEVEKFISPIVLAFLLNRYKNSSPSVQLIKYIMLPNFKIPNKQSNKNMNKIEKLDYLLAQNGIKRGYNSFIQNFFKIIEILEDEFSKTKPDPIFNVQEFLFNNRDKIFSDYLPFPNKIIFASETNELGKYIDKDLINPINVIRRLTGIDIYTKPSSVKQNKVANSLINLADFYVHYMREVFFKKTGLIRQHISSTRSHFTARAVITSISGPHEHDELHIPWSIACTLLREHVLNRLYKRGYNYKQAINLLMYHNRIYNPLLDEIFKEIISSTGEGIRCTLNRNPSLHRGSMQLVRITKVKTDTKDNTFSMSYLIAPSFNADYDGDELNLALILTNKVYRNVDSLRPYHNILGLTGVNDFTSNIKFPKTIVSTLSNWFVKD